MPITAISVNMGKGSNIVSKLLKKCVICCYSVTIAICEFPCCNKAQVVGLLCGSRRPIFKNRDSVTASSSNRLHLPNRKKKLRNDGKNVDSTLPPTL